MQLKIITKEENPLLSRTEIKAELSFKGATPSADTVKAELGKQLNADVKLIFIKKIETSFGHQEAKAEVHVYKDAKVMNSLIKKGKKALEKEKKANEESAKKAEEAKAAAAKKAEEVKAAAEKSTEATTEENKEEKSE